MHGVKRHTKNDGEKALEGQKAATYLQLVKLILHKRASGSDALTHESLALTSKMIKANPDFYSLWNFRRDILIALYGESLGLSNECTNQVVGCVVTRYFV
jgi:geranylgeranyl transferase type-2 subunit alpha